MVFALPPEGLGWASARPGLFYSGADHTPVPSPRPVAFTIGDLFHDGFLRTETTLVLPATRAVNITRGGFDVGDATSLFVESAISGGDGSSLTKRGAGRLVFIGSNTYTGITKVDDGILEIGASERLADASTLRVLDGGTFDLIDFGSITGALDQINFPALQSGLSFDTSSLLTTGSLAVVPEPAALTILALGGLMMTRRRRRLAA